MDYAELSRLLDAHKQSITTQLAETKSALAEFEKKGSVDPETKDKLARLEAKGEEIANAYKDFREKEYKTLLEEKAQLRKDLDEVATRLNRKTVNGFVPGMEEGLTTYGQAFTDSKEFQEWRQRGKQGPLSLELRKAYSSPGTVLTTGRFDETKAAAPAAPVAPSQFGTALPAGSQGQWFTVAPFVAPGIYRPAELPLAMRSVIPSTPMTGSTLWYVREKAPYDYSTYTADYQILYGDKKKTSTILYETISQPVSTIAHYIKVPTQQLDDAPALQGDINNRLLYGLGRKEDYEFLYGDNTNGHIAGIQPAATAFNKTAWDTAHPSSTAIDYLAGMLSQLSTQGFIATAIMVPPGAYWSMSILKSTTGSYLLGGPVQPAALQIWGVPLVLNYQMTTGTALVGDFRMGAGIYDRMSATIATATQNEDDFLRNQIAIRAEERVALAIYMGSAFVYMAAFPAVLEEAEKAAHSAKSK